MMQAFRNSAKVAGAIFALLMLIFMATSVSLAYLSSAGDRELRKFDTKQGK